MENGKHGQSEVVQWLRAQSLSRLAQPVCPTDKMRRCCSVGFYSHEYLALSAVIWLRTRDGLHHDPHPGPPPLRSEWAADGRPGPAGQVLH